MNLFQILFAPLCAALALAWAVWTLRRAVPRRVGFVWTVIWSVAALVIAVPQSTVVVASWFGIGRGSDLVVYLAILAGLAACLYFYRRYRRLEVLLTEVVRRSALESARRGPARAEKRDPATSDR